LVPLMLSRKLVARLDPEPMPSQPSSPVPSQMQLSVFAAAAPAGRLRQVCESLLAVVTTPEVVCRLRIAILFGETRGQRSGGSGGA
jgi:hypothetical protein